jgi:hypothetical protein
MSSPVIIPSTAFSAIDLLANGAPRGRRFIDDELIKAGHA